jgi:putative ABC transport system permease protein
LSSLRIAWRLVQARGLHHAVTALVLALGLGLMLATVAVGDAARGAVSELASRYPLVVGPRVGAVPLVLGSLTGLQDLEAGVPVDAYRALQSDPRVELAVPLLAGHAVRDHALVGTTTGRLLPRERYPLADGRVFEEGAKDEVVLGASAAEALALGVGDRLELEHQHAGAPSEPGELRVVGVLEPTHGTDDDTLFCSIEAIFRSHEAHEHDTHEHDAHEHDAHEHDAHEHAQLVSSILIRPVSDSALLSLQEELGDGDLELALTGQTLRRVADRLAGGGRLVRLLVGGVVLVTFLSLLMSVYSASLAQAQEVAVLRVLGARRWQVLVIVGLATTAVVSAGCLGAFILGSALGGVAESVLRQELGLEVSVSLLSGQAPTYLGIGLAVLVGMGLQPALAAYHLQAAEALAATAGSGLATRSYLRWSLRFLVPLAVFVWAEQMVVQHGGEGFSRPLDAESSALFDANRAWTTGDAPPSLTALNGTRVSVEGYMYALGDPWEVEDFFLVAINPRLPRCPFCYRAPTRHERILVRSPGGLHEVAPGMVRISGLLTLMPEERDQVVVTLDTFEVVVSD